jgi:hypothetical protein
MTTITVANDNAQDKAVQDVAIQIADAMRAVVSQFNTFAKAASENTTPMTRKQYRLREEQATFCLQAARNLDELAHWLAPVVEQGTPEELRGPKRPPTYFVRLEGAGGHTEEQAEEIKGKLAAAGLGAIVESQCLEEPADDVPF